MQLWCSQIVDVRKYFEIYSKIKQTAKPRNTKYASILYACALYAAHRNNVHAIAMKCVYILCPILK